MIDSLDKLVKILHYGLVRGGSEEEGYFFYPIPLLFVEDNELSPKEMGSRPSREFIEGKKKELLEFFEL